MCKPIKWGATGWALVVVCLLWVGTAPAQEGSSVGWGGVVVVPQTELTDFVSVASRWYHSLGLKADGAIVAWGANDSGQCNLPAPNAGFVAIAGGGFHSLGLKVDGSVVAWGENNSRDYDVPAPNAGFVVVAGGVHHSLGLKTHVGDVNCDGTVDFGDINPLVALRTGYR
jgi:alpha-tubulin suppressor-like RCC1 family protein